MGGREGGREEGGLLSSDSYFDMHPRWLSAFTVIKFRQKRYEERMWDLFINVSHAVT